MFHIISRIIRVYSCISECPDRISIRNRVVPKESYDTQNNVLNQNLLQPKHFLKEILVPFDNLCHWVGV